MISIIKKTSNKDNTSNISNIVNHSNIKNISYVVMVAAMLLTIAFEAMASIEGFTSKLTNIGISTNVNKPGVVNDQLGGFMTGGSLHTRNQVSNVQLMTIDPPSFSAGCGGIDLFAGGFGYINSAKLQALFKDIGSSAVSYAQMLTIKTISPQIADILAELESMARFMNSQNINSCQMGASIATGMWPKNAASQELACQSKKMGGANKVSNFFTARYDCGAGNSVSTNDEDMKGLLGSNYNLVFTALKKSNPNISNDVIEELMSISGSLIAKGKDNAISFEHKNSLIKDAKMIEMLIYGNSDDLKLYKCDDGIKCLNLGITAKKFDKDNSYLAKITKLVQSISEKLISETKGQITSLSEEEKLLIQTSSVPILKIISLEVGLKGHSTTLAIEEYAEVVAYDYIVNYLDSMLDFVYKAVTNLEHAQIDGEVIKSFKQEIRYVKGLLLSERGQAFEKMNILLSVKQRMMQIEGMLKNAFSEYRNLKD
jgi:conjugative transfer pilus assembly protein TraH